MSFLRGLFGPPDVDAMVDERDVEGLIKALSYQKDADVRETAARALRDIGDPTTVPALIKALDDSESLVRRIGAQGLGVAGDPAAVPGLIEALRDSDKDVRSSAASALGKIGDPAAVPALIEALGDSDPGVRIMAPAALTGIGSPAVPALIEALDDANEDVRRNAAEALRDIGDPAAVPALIEALDDHKWRVRTTAAEALGEIGDSTAVPALVEALADIQLLVRRHAAEALGKIGDPAAVPALIEALGDGESAVRDSAAAALGEIGDPAVSALIAALGDEDPTARETAAGALDDLGWKPGRDATGAAYWIARREWDRCVEIGAPAVEPLAALLQDRDSSVRREAAGALGRIGDARAVAPLVDVLKVEDVAAVRKRAREALERIGEATGVELPDLEQPRVGTIEDVTKAKAQGHVAALIQALRKHHNFLVRQRAARALGELGHERAVEPLFAALDDDAVNVQNNAAEALVEIGGPEVISRFIGMMFHATGPRKQAIADALEQITGEDFGTNSYGWQEWWKGQRKD